MAASACFVPAPPAHASTTRVAAALLLCCWVASGFASGFVLAVGSSPAPAAARAVVSSAGPMPYVERLPGRATFYRPAGSSAERPAFGTRTRVYRPVRSLAFARLEPGVR